MKHKINLSKIVITFVLMGLWNYVCAQFIPATVAETSVGAANISPTSTGTANDAFYEVVNGIPNSYRVSIFNNINSLLNGTPGIQWSVTQGVNTYNGYWSFANGFNSAQLPAITHFDVALVPDAGQGNTDMYALVSCYVRAVSGYPPAVGILELKWDDINKYFFFTGNSYFWNVTIGTGLHIDSEIKGNFAMVYDDPSKNLWVVTGRCNGGTNLYTPGGIAQPVMLPTGTSKGSYPDISITQNGNINPINWDNPVAHISFITNSGALKVNDYKFQGATGIAFSTTPAATPNVMLVTPPHAGLSFQNPRIASANTIFLNDYTVVVEETNHSNINYILGYESLPGNSNPTAVVYNNGSVTAANVSSALNSTPVVTYDKNNNIWVGWLLDNTSNMIAGAPAGVITPIAVKCNINAMPVISNYWQAPFNTSASATLLSMSGRWANDELYLTYFGIGGSLDMFYKTITTVSSAVSFRTTVDITSGETVVPTDEQATADLYDLTGKLIWQQRNSVTELNAVIKQKQMELPRAVYILKMVSDDGKNSLTKKFFIN